MRHRQFVSAGLAVILLAVGGVGGCSTAPGSGGAPDPAPVTAVAPGVTVQGAGSVTVTSIPQPQAAAALEKGVTVGHRQLPSALVVLATPRRLIASGPLPAGGVVLSFRVSQQRAAAGTTPVLASYDPATGLWVPVPSRYDPATGVVSARVPHFSIWAPIQWLTSRVEAVLEGVAASLFSLGGIGSPPSCSGQAVTVTDSHPHGGIAACAGVTGTDQVTAKIVNQRPYAVDLLYPSAVHVTVPASDPFAELGADLTRLASNWHYQVLLPGGGEADASVPLPPGQRAQFVTQWDNEAYLWGILGTGIRALVEMTGGVAGHSAQYLVRALSGASCLGDVVDIASSPGLSLATAEKIGSAALDCLSAVAKGAGGVVATVASIIASLDVALVSSVYSAIDIITGAASHNLILTAPAANSGPAPSPTPPSSGQPTDAAWTAAQPPLPGDADSTSDSAINDVSCPSATSCLATGYYTDTSGVQQGMLLTWSDGAWTAAGKAPYTETLSCVTASLCVAVDGPDIETWSSGTWTYTSVPAPADNGSDPASLDSVSCVSASFCVAAGSYTDTSGSTKGLLETLSDGAWTVEQAPLPADAAANPDVSFRSGPGTNLVSCPSASFCVAAGYYTDASGSTEGLLETWSDGAWTATKAPLPADAAANPAAAILGVSCPTASFCLATGDYTGSDNGSRSLLETWSGGSWSVTTVQAQTNVVGPVACVSTSACVITVIGGSEVLTSSGGSWTAAQFPAPPYGVLWDISNLACASASHCVAVGDSSDATNEHWQAVMATGPG